MRVALPGRIVSNRFPPLNAARLSSDSSRTGSSVRLTSHSMRAPQPRCWQPTENAYSGP